MKPGTLLKLPFPFLDLPRHRWILILFSVSFSIFFLNVFVPFNIDRWSSDAGWEQFLRLSGFGIIAGFVLIASQFGFRRFFKVKQFSLGAFLLSFSIELLLMAALFVFYVAHWELSVSRFLSDIPVGFRLTLLGVLIPYSLSLLLISQIQQKKKLNHLKIKADKSGFEDGLINFRDEKGTVRFSIAGEQLLYIESADNYVIVYFQSGNKSVRQILRNSMKNIEELLHNSPMKRCHRSFMVNLQKIERVAYEKTSCRIKLNGVETFIPVSRKFFPEFKPYLLSGESELV